MSGVTTPISLLLGLTIVLAQDIREPPTIVEPLKKKSHFYKANDRVNITCIATGTPQPTYEWRYNDATISSQFMSFDAVTGVLTIPSLTEREEGLFTCRATNRFPNGQTATAVSATVEIRVARTGDFTRSPSKTIPAQEGKYLKLACDDRIPIYYGPISFRWYITTLDNKLTEIIQDNRIFIDQVGSLHFAYVLKRDESVLGTRYQCAISNSGQGIIKLGSDNIITVTAQGLQDQKPILQYRSMGKSSVVLRNGDALLECLFSGYTSNATNKVPSVTWFNDGVQISGNGRYVIGPFGRTLIIKSVQESDEKTYICRASNALGQNEGQVSLNVTSTPIWVRPVQNVIVPEGESAKFTCLARSAIGENPPDPPEWYLNGLRMASYYDPNKYIFSDGKRELTVLNTNKDTDIACFQCYVSNSNGQEFDDGCLNVILQINIVLQPPKLYQEIEKGDIVSLTVLATGDPSTPLTYRWIFKNKTFDDLSPPPHVQFNPVTKLAFINTTELSEAQLINITGIYQREVFHKYQAKRVNIEVRLKRILIREPPTIVEPLNKESHFYRANDRVNITCIATGTPQPTYEWRYNDATISSQFMSFDAVTGVLTIPSLTEREEGLFTCRATNRFPNGQTATAVSATVEIRVARIGDFTTSPSKTIPAQEGKYLKLACDDKIPIYYGPTSFRWYITTLDSKLTEIIQDNRIFIDQVGSLHFAYVLKSDESVLGTRYQCALSNSLQGIIKLGSDNIITVTAQGLQDQKPILQYRSMGKSAVVLRNGDALLECLFSGYTSNATNKVPSVTWFDDAGVQISGNSHYVIGPFGRTLIIKNVQESDEKAYTCRASNALGQEEGQVLLNVTSTPIWVRPVQNVIVPEGESAKFTCLARSAIGENPPDPPEWYLNGLRMASNYNYDKYIFSDGKRELTVLNTNKDTDIACFQCYVSNSNGQEFDDGCLNVILQINIVIQPPKLYQEIEKGDIANLTVLATADSSTPLTYRWIFRNKTFDDLSPPPHVQVNPVTKLAFINTTELSEAQLINITGIYQREVFHKYQAKHVNIEVRLKRILSSSGSTFLVSFGSVFWLFFAVILIYLDLP